MNQYSLSTLLMDVELYLSCFKCVLVSCDQVAGVVSTF